jgi:hypothetical protein
MSTPNQELLARYNKHIEVRKARGERLASYKCPSCEGTIECSIPARGQIYDSLVECPHCGKMHFKVVYDDGDVFCSQPRCGRRAPSAQKGFTLVGLLASLLVYALIIGGLAALANAFMPAPPTAASSRYTVTVYTARIGGQPVTCTETHDHHTGARERAC